MNFKITTTVSTPFRQVFRLFTKELFIKLSPPFPRLKLLRFDGSNTQDHVAVELDFLLFKQEWESVIVEKKESKEEIYFVDEGIKLPFFLKKWKHKHRIIQKDNKQAEIIDEIEFETPFKPLDILLYPILYFQFAYRKPIYQKVFGKEKTN